MRIMLFFNIIILIKKVCFYMIWVLNFISELFCLILMERKFYRLGVIKEEYLWLYFISLIGGICSKFL